jgi:hypothetical protein
MTLTHSDTFNDDDDDDDADIVVKKRERAFESDKTKWNIIESERERKMRKACSGRNVVAQKRRSGGRMMMEFIGMDIRLYGEEN